MRKALALFIISIFILLVACENPPDPTQAEWELTPQQIFFRKMVAIGNSLTAGFQSAGLVKDFQENSYPYLVAQQMGMAQNFEMPIVEDPGIGSSDTGDDATVATPLFLDPATGMPVFDTYPLTNVPGLLSNVNLARPYDNLAVPGATLKDLLDATDAASSSDPNNSFYQFILRNPTLGNMTMLDQALSLNPSLILLWIGNNDVLGAALSGTAQVGVTITPQDVFEADFTRLIQRIGTESNALVIMANIPYVTDIPYVNMLDIIFRDVQNFGNVPVVFDETFTPVDFGGGMHIPLMTTEQNVANLLLPALSAYQQGMGVPDSAALTNAPYNYPPALASGLVAAMRGGGLNPTGQPFPAEFTLTTDEISTIEGAVDGFNATLNNFALQNSIPIVDVNSMLSEVNQGGVNGVTGLFALLDPATTAFSLDGVHPNNAGHALVANAFIDQITAATGVTIPKLTVANYTGQYSSGMSKKIPMESITKVKSIFKSPVK